MKCVEYGFVTILTRLVCLKLIERPAAVGSKWVMHMFLLSPAGWEEEQVSSPSILRLIFQGRFLHGNVTLGGKTLSEYLFKRIK